MLRPRESNDLPLQCGQYSDHFCRHLQQHRSSTLLSLLQASGAKMQTLIVTDSSTVARGMPSGARPISCPEPKNTSLNIL